MAKKSTAGKIITDGEAAAALLRSGYLLESRIEAVLDAEGYYVEANTAYTDPVTGKPRELDVVALAGKQVTKDVDLFFPYLLIECVNNPQPLAFITNEPQAALLFAADVKFSGLPVKLLEAGERDSWLGLGDSLQMDKFHHYCAGRVSTQFCSFIQKKGATDDWMALHEDAHFDSMRKLCDGVDFFSERHFRDWSFDQSVREPINIQVYYPILVVQNRLLDVSQDKGALQIADAQHIHYLQRTVVRGEEESYHIDVVTETFFPSLVRLIEEETTKAIRRLQRRKTQVERSIDAICRQARKAKTEDAVVRVLKF